MLKILLVFIGTIPFIGWSQSVWTKNNPVWHYDYWNYNDQGFIKIEKQDSVLHDGHWCDHLVATKYKFFASGPPPSPITYIVEDYQGGDVYVSNDTVFYWDVDHFSILYDFSAAVGESWLLQNGVNVPSEFQCNDSSIVNVVSIGNVSLSGEVTTQLNLSSPSENAYLFEGAVNARFGAMGTNYLFPMLHSCDSLLIFDADVISFKCFQDDSLFYNPSGEDCEYLLTHLSISEEKLSAIQANPNPVEDWLMFSSQDELLNATFFDSKGKQIEVLNFQQKGWDLSALSKGIYIVVVETKNGTKQSVRVLKK